MASTSLLNFFLLYILFLSVSPSHSASSNELPKTGYITLPINIDQTTHQYYTSIGIGTPRHNINLAIDLEGKSLWYDCDTHYNSTSYSPVSCDDSQKCPQGSPCIGCNGFPTKPGCTNNTCGVDVVNPFADTIFSGDLGEDLLYLPGAKVPKKFLSGCADSDRFTTPLLVGFANGTKGLLGLARRTQLSLPIQISSTYNIIPKFALCLPSKGIGQVFIGGGPYPLNSVPNHVAFTISPSDEYYISINSINIDGKIVNFSSSILSIDEEGNGGTKISAMSPYTVLHNSIYKPFVRDFVKKASDRKIKRVKSVAPFGACFDANTIGDSDEGPAVPAINLVLDSQGVHYGISGHNSMIEVKKNVLCLAFVDGGKEAKAGIVIGGHQMEDRVLEFDLSTSILRFSSSVLLHNASCSNPSSLKF